MITAVEQPSHRTRALAISLALHGSLLVLIAATVPAWRGVPWGAALREACLQPCGVVTIRLLTHAMAESMAPPNRTLVRPQRLPGAARPRSDVAAASGVTVVVAAAPRGRAVAPVAFALHPPAVVALPPLMPSTTVSLQDVRLHVRPDLAPGNWGSHFDVPVLRDRDLYDELLAALPKGSTVTIAVDDHGHATDVRIVAPGLDAALLAKLRERLLAASYAPVERNGVAFEGKLKIAR